MKKLLDVEKMRRVKCRHFNGTISQARIFCTNSGKGDFFPHMTQKHDRTGVLRRQLFQAVSSDVRRRPQAQVPPVMVSAVQDGAEWKDFLHDVCQRASVASQKGRILSAAINFGVALAIEVQENGRQLSESAGLKPLECARFLYALAPGCGQERLSPPSDEEGDPFGFGFWMENIS